jgi:uncharacterized protein
MNTRDGIVRQIQELLPRLQDLGAVSVSLFGSAARGELRPDSDVDVLVEFDDPGARGYFDALFLLEDTLGRRVDLVTPDTIHRRIRDRVLREALRVA